MSARAIFPSLVCVSLILTSVPAYPGWLDDLTKAAKEAEKILEGMQKTPEQSPQPEPERSPPPAPAPPPEPAVQTEPAPTQPAPIVKDDRMVVKEVQRRLADLGYSPGPADGMYGSKTSRAIAAFQRDRSLVVDGQVSDALLASLRSAKPSKLDTAKSGAAYPDLTKPLAKEEESVVAPPPIVSAAGSDGEKKLEVESREPDLGDTSARGSMVRQGDQMVTRGAEEDGRAALVRALNKLSLTIAQKIDRDVATIATAFWEARRLEDDPEGTNSAMAPLTAVERGTKQITAANSWESSVEILKNAESPLELYTMLSSLSAVVFYPDGARDWAKPSIDIAQARIMIEVAYLYPESEGFRVAMTLYLLGFGDVVSPIQIARRGANRGEKAVHAASGGSAVRTRLRHELERNGTEFGDVQFRPSFNLEAFVTQLERLEVELRALQSKQFQASAAVCSTACGNGLSLPPRLGIIQTLEKIRQGLLTRKGSGDKVFVDSSVKSGTIDDSPFLSAALTYRFHGSSKLGTLERKVAVPTVLSVKPFSKQYTLDVRTQLKEIAYEMLVNLPAELGGLWYLVDKVDEEIRGGMVMPERMAQSPDRVPGDADAALPTKGRSSLSSTTVEQEREPEIAAPVAQSTVAGADSTAVATATPVVTRAEKMSAVPTPSKQLVDEKDAGETQSNSSGRGSALEGSAVGARPVRLTLRDGSVLIATLTGGQIQYKSAFGTFAIEVQDVASIDEDELKLSDGTVLKGAIRGGDIDLKTQFGRHSISADSITSMSQIDSEN